MPRSGRLRSFIREYNESQKTKRMSFIPPYIILVIEFALFLYAFIEREIIVMILTSILLVISIIEAVLVSKEVHEEYVRINCDRIITIKLDDFITETKEINVKRIVESFIDKYPEYAPNRNDIYRTTCQILETHKQEKIEKILTGELEKFIKKNKKMTVDEIVNSFLSKFQKYKKYRSEVYEKTCKIKGEE